MAGEFEVPGELNSLEDDLAALIHSTISAIPANITDQEYTDTMKKLADDIIAHIVLVDPVRNGGSVQIPANVEHARTMLLVANSWLKDNDSDYKGL